MVVYVYCSHHSASDGTYDMVKSGGMLLFRCNIIKFLNSTVDAIIYRFGKTFYFSLPGGTLSPSNGNSRPMNNLRAGTETRPG
jgi:hypothetical protein